MKTPLLLVLTGLFLALAGLTFDVFFAGIPYQDPTPEMTERYERNSLIASAILWTGIAVLIAGSCAAFFRMTRTGGPSAKP